MSYNCSVLTITSTAVPDPYVLQAHGKYYLVRVSQCCNTDCDQG